MEKTIEKVVCGYREMFYAECESTPHIRELLLQFRLNPSSSNAEALLDDEGVRGYCDKLSHECPSKCSCFGINLKERVETFKKAEKRPGGLCAVALYEKAALVASNRW